MASHPRWQQVGGNAADVYERHLVPPMFAPWAPTLIDLARVQAKRIWGRSIAGWPRGGANSGRPALSVTPSW